MHPLLAIRQRQQAQLGHTRYNCLQMTTYISHVMSSCCRRMRCVNLTLHAIQACRPPWQSSRWGAIGQLRQALSNPDDLTTLPAGLAADTRMLSVAEWACVFNYGNTSSPEPPLPLPARAAIMQAPVQWLALLRTVSTPALATFILCSALPAAHRHDTLALLAASRAHGNACRKCKPATACARICVLSGRIQISHGSRTADMPNLVLSEHAAMRCLVGLCFAHMRLAELQPADMQLLIQARALDECMHAGCWVGAELRLRYFAATHVLLQN